MQAITNLRMRNNIETQNGTSTLEWKYYSILEWKILYLRVEISTLEWNTSILEWKYSIIEWNGNDPSEPPYSYYKDLQVLSHHFIFQYYFMNLQLYVKPIVASFFISLYILSAWS